MRAHSLLGRLSGSTLVVLGACDEDLISEIIRSSAARLIWLRPGEAGAAEAAETVSQARQSGRLHIVDGEPAGALQALAPQLAGQRLTLLLADREGELGRSGAVVRDLLGILRQMSGSEPRVVMAVRQGKRTAARLTDLVNMVPGDGKPSWLIAADSADAGTGGTAFDMRLVDENEHLIPRPIGTLQTLNLDHLHRYAFAKSFCYNADVLDAAMGCGYSSLLLNCRRYTGVDIDHNMVAFANQHYAPIVPNATYLQGSVLELPVPDAAIDTFISFETIEHLQPTDIGRYFAEVKRVVRPGGLFLCSTPVYRGDAYGILTRYHPFEFRYGHFESVLVGNGFDLQEVWYQWPPYYCLQKVIPSFEQTQQPAPMIAVTVSRVR